MLEFIRRRDADGVERLVREHILRGQAAVIRYLDGGQDIRNPNEKGKRQ
jgi:DNA-binding GntR family transcriptional regulator